MISLPNCQRMFTLTKTEQLANLNFIVPIRLRWETWLAELTLIGFDYHQSEVKRHYQKYIDNCYIAQSPYSVCRLLILHVNEMTSVAKADHHLVGCKFLPTSTGIIRVLVSVLDPLSMTTPCERYCPMELRSSNFGAREGNSDDTMGQDGHQEVGPCLFQGPYSGVSRSQQV